MAEDITLPSGKMIRAYNGLGIIGSEDQLIVGTGSAVSPFYPLLVCAKLARDRSDDRITLDGLKHSRLSSGLV